MTARALPALLAAALLAALAGCASSDTAESSGGEPFSDIVISYPAKAPANWPLFLAKEGGYYENNGLNATLEFGVHPAGIAMLASGEAQMTNYTLEQAMQAVAQNGDFVIVGSPLNSGLFAMMAKSEFNSPADLKGKRFGVSQIGDAPYNFASAILEANGLTQRDVDWIPIGTEGGGRVAALTSGRIDATMIPPPAYFRLESEGFKEIANLADYDQLYAPMSYVIPRSAIARDPTLPERLIKSAAEGIKRYYDDKQFAMQAYAIYDPQGAADIERIYDHDREDNTYERVPYVLAPAVDYIINHQVDEQLTARLQNFDFSTAIDNSYVDTLVEEGYFRELFGAGVAEEEQRKAAIAFR